MKKSIYYNVFFNEVPRGMQVYDVNLKGFDENILLDGQVIEDWSVDASIKVRGEILTDYLFCPLCPWLPISDPVKRTIEKMGVVGIQFLPLQVIHEQGCKLSEYFVLNILNVVSALNYGDSTWVTDKKWNVPHPQLNIEEIVLWEKKIGGNHIFRIAEMKTQVFFSGLLRDALIMNKASSGFKFLPVNTK